MPERRSCTYAPCEAPAHVVALLAFGELPLCAQHWRAARGELEQCATFDRAVNLSAPAA